MEESKWTKLLNEFGKQYPDLKTIDEMKIGENWWLVFYGNGKEMRICGYWGRNNVIDLMQMINDDISLLNMLEDAVLLARANLKRGING